MLLRAKSVVVLGVAVLGGLIAGIDPAASQVSLPNCNNKPYTVGLSNGNDLWFDRVDGTTDKDVVSAGDGDDTLDSEGKEDDVCGHQDQDAIALGLGTDWGNGGDEVDVVAGGDDNDEIHGGENGDDLLGEDGGDRNVFGELGPDEINGGAGNDDLSGNEQDDDIHGGGGPDDIARGGAHSTGDTCDAETEYTCDP
jgi:Ca2+-binding RTX toxin-like protein